MLVKFRNDNFRSILVVRDFQAAGYMSQLDKSVNRIIQYMLITKFNDLPAKLYNYINAVNTLLPNKQTKNELH